MNLPAAIARGRPTLLRFLLAMAAGNLVWEAAHVPLYTIWVSGSRGEIAYAVLHCTVGDVLIATSTLAVALAVFGRNGWPGLGYVSVVLAMILLAASYTMFSEWLNVEVRGSWAYRDLMPRLPGVGTGLTPLLQWLLVPAAAFWWARRTWYPERI